MFPENNGNTAIIAVSRPGAALARRLAAALPDAELHLERRVASGDDTTARPYDLPLRPVLQNLFVNRDALIVFLPVGAAVRLLAPVFAGKKRDPAVVCVDDGGRYAISLLSGHAGGADELSRQVADAIGAQAVITSASHALNITAIDLVGRKSGWRIESSPTDLTRAAAAVVNGDPVALWLDPETGAGWPNDSPLSDGIVIVDSLDDATAGGYAAILVVSDRLLTLDTKRPLVIYRPPTLVAGVGCRRGVDAAHLQELFNDTLRENGLAAQSVAKIATVDLKDDEPGIIALADSLAVPLRIYAADELNAAAHREPQSADSQHGLHRPTPSAASDLLGVFRRSGAGGDAGGRRIRRHRPPRQVGSCYHSRRAHIGDRPRRNGGGSHDYALAGNHAARRGSAGSGRVGNQQRQPATGRRPGLAGNYGSAGRRRRAARDALYQPGRSCKSGQSSGRHCRAAVAGRDLHVPAFDGIFGCRFPTAKNVRIKKRR